MKALNFLLARGREPSSYAGLAAALAAFGFSVDPGMLQNVVNIATGVAGIAALLLRDK